MIDELEYELKNFNVNKLNLYFIQGKIDGLFDGQNMTHKKAVEIIVALKKEIIELNEDFELFEYEIEYNKGYYNGLEKILNFNREYFKMDMPILFVSYFENNMLLEKYQAAMQFSGMKEYDSESNNREMYFFSDDVEEIINIINENKNRNIELSLSVIVNSKTSPILDKLNRISEVEPENIFVILDKGVINARNMIEKILSYHVVE